MLASSCGGSQEAPLPARPAVVNVTLSDEYRFAYRPPTSAGRTVFRVRNGGRLGHELILLPLPPDFPPLKEQLRGSKRRAIGTLAFLQPLKAGERGVFAVDLKRGRYGMVCFVKGADGVPYSQKGMVSEFRVP